MNTSEIEYKGYYITFNFYGFNEYTVQDDRGDDVFFDTEAEAKEYLDSEFPD